MTHRYVCTYQTHITDYNYEFEVDICHEWQVGINCCCKRRTCGTADHRTGSKNTKYPAGVGEQACCCKLPPLRAEPLVYTSDALTRTGTVVVTTSTQTTSSMPVDSDEDTDSPMEEDSDGDYAPSSSSSSSSCEDPLTETEHGDGDKFIVYWSCLLSLLKLMACSRCGEMESSITSMTKGTLLLGHHHHVHDGPSKFKPQVLPLCPAMPCGLLQQCLSVLNPGSP